MSGAEYRDRAGSRFASWIKWRKINKMGRFIILSGPSCVGKGPLHEAFIKFYPELAGKLKKLVLCNSRAPRPAEIDGKDYHFRKREEIERWRGKENFIVLEVRGDLQAVDLEQASQALEEGDRAACTGRNSLFAVARSACVADRLCN